MATMKMPCAVGSGGSNVEITPSASMSSSTLTDENTVAIYGSITVPSGGWTATDPIATVSPAPSSEMTYSSALYRQDQTTNKRGLKIKTDGGIYIDSAITTGNTTWVIDGIIAYSYS